VSGTVSSYERSESELASNPLLLFLSSVLVALEDELSPVVFIKS